MRIVVIDELHARGDEQFEGAIPRWLVPCVLKSARRVAAHPREDFSVTAARTANYEINYPKKAGGAQDTAELT